VNYYCINLKSATTRKCKISEQAQAASIDIIFIEAIEGKSLDINAIASYNKFKRSRYMYDMEPNEIACTLSHRLALETFLNDPYPYCVVLEDDAIFPESIDADIANLLDSVKGFDLLKLESRDAKGYEIGQVDGTRIMLPLKGGNGATGILYTKSGARKLLASLEDFYFPFDTHIGLSWGSRLLCAACWPSLIVEDKSSQSNIGGRTASKRKPGLYPWMLARYERVVHSLMKRIHCLVIKHRKTIKTQNLIACDPQ